MKDLKVILEDLCFESEAFEELFKSFKDCTKNPSRMRYLIDLCETDGIKCTELKAALAEHYAQECTLSKEDIKSVYIKLKDREKNPRGQFDKAGLFYIEDGELLNVRSPSAQYPYSQMNAARTAKFVKALAEKYKCSTLEDLEAVAFSDK